MFYFTADLHLQHSAWAGREDLAGDALRAFDFIVESAIKEKPEALILGGDILDAPVTSSEVVDRLDFGVKRLIGAGIKVLFIQGQHCRAVPPWLLRHETTPLEAEGWKSKAGLRIFGLDNLPAGALHDYLQTMQRQDDDILVLHQLCKGAPCVNWDFDPAWLADWPNLKLVLLGDLHIPWHEKFPKKGGKFEVIYSGSTAMQSIDEPPEKSFIKVNDDCSLDFVPIPSRLFRLYTATTAQDLVNIERQLAELPKSDRKPLVVLKYSSELSGAGKLCAAHPEVVWMPKPLAPELPLAGFASAVVPEKVSLSGCLDGIVKREEKPELHSFLAQVLAAPDPKTVIDAKINEITPAGVV